MITVGIDLGTTTISLAVFDTGRKKVIEAKTTANHSFIETGNDWERIQDVQKITATAKAELDALLERHPDISAIGLTWQMHGILYLDAEGRCISPLYTWQDQRGNLPAFAAEDEAGEERCASPLYTWQDQRGNLPAFAAEDGPAGERRTSPLYTRQDQRGNLPEFAAEDEPAEGRCISPLYTWQDQRGNLPEFAAEDGSAQGSAETADGCGACPEGPEHGGEHSARRRLSMTGWIRERCGIETASGYGLVTHCYQCRKGLVPESAAALCTIPDYLGMVLTGRKRPLLHAGMAASLGFFDVQRGEFLRDALRLAGADVSVLPEVTDEAAVLGTYRGLPVVTAMGDNQASFLGSAGADGDALLVNMGTGGQISVLSDRYFAAPGIEARPFLPGRYLLAGSSLCGGRAYAILENFLRSYLAAAGAGNCQQYGTMEALAQKTLEMREGTDCGLRVSTTFKGTRVDPDMRGSITGIDENNFTPGNLILGVLEGMTRELYDMYMTICAGAGIRAERVVASGNGVRRNPVLQRLIAQMFQAKLQLADCEEEAACGAALSCEYALAG